MNRHQLLQKNPEATMKKAIEEARRKKFKTSAVIANRRRSNAQKLEKMKMKSKQRTRK